MDKPIKQRYMTSAALLIVSSVIVKIISAVYKIPLTAYIGSVGRGYFSVAYNLFMPVHAVTMGAFPIALSKLVSKSLAKGDTSHAYQLKKGADKLFFFVGVAGLAFMLAFAKPYANIISSAPKSIYTIVVLMPCAVFSSMAASRRAFAEGHMNMIPTAVSQIFDSLFKMVFGLLFARLSMSYFYNEYTLYGNIFSVILKNEQEALSFIYPLTSAAAMAGVTVGSFFSMLYVMLYSLFKYPIKPYKATYTYHSTSESISELWQFTLPLIAATVIQSLATFFDTSGIQYCLSLCDKSLLAERYSASLLLASVTKSDLCTYLFGLYSSVLDFKNLVPGVTMALGVAAVPAISAAYENSSTRFSELITSIFKYTVILSVGGGAVISLFAGNILSLFYSSSNPDIVVGGKNILFWFGVTMVPSCLASTAVFSVQALGLAKKLILPYSVSAVLRLFCDFIFVRNEAVNIYGGVISSFVGYTIIMVSAMVIMKNSTNVKYNYNDIFIKPFITAILSYFLTRCIYMSLNGQMGFYLSLLISILIFLTVFVILLFVFGSVSLKDVKFVNNQ